MERAVADARLKRSVVSKVAWHVVEGRLPIQVVNRILDQLEAHDRAGTLTAPRWSYFAGTMRRYCHLHGITWKTVETVDPRETRAENGHENR
jgi:hypothetical protein